MKITLYKKAPKCPKCKVPMQFESMTYSDKIQKKVDCENHKWLLERKEEMSYRKGKYFYYEKCEKSIVIPDFSIFMMLVYIVVLNV